MIIVGIVPTSSLNEGSDSWGIVLEIRIQYQEGDPLSIRYEDNKIIGA